MRVRDVLPFLTPAIFYFFLVLILPCSARAAPIGLCYGRVADNLPPPSTTVSLLESNGIANVRVFNTDATTLHSFAGTGINLMIGVPNENLSSLASGTVDFAIDWLQTAIFSHIPPNQVKYIAVGNEIFLKDPFYTPFVVPAIRSLYQALQVFNLANNIKLSSPLAASVLSNSYPPSSGTFDPSLRSATIPLLQFLYESNSPLMINVYPYFSYVNNMEYVKLDYALFTSTNVEEDGGLIYGNLFDASVDAFVHAMEREGFIGVKVVVAETGWPTSGGEVADEANARTYNQNVVKRAVDCVGTPKRPNEEIEVYLFDLFNEDEKRGGESEKHFGIFGLDGIKVYDLNFN